MPVRPQSGLRVMVVEDETSMAALLGNYLERDGFEVSVVHDGLEAVKLAREVDPDIVVLDLGLPGIDGVEVCRQLRTFSDAYVVMLTARSDEVDTLIGLSVGADDYTSGTCATISETIRTRQRSCAPCAAPVTGWGPASDQAAGR